MDTLCAVSESTCQQLGEEDSKKKKKSLAKNKLLGMPLHEFIQYLLEYRWVVCWALFLRVFSCLMWLYGGYSCKTTEHSTWPLLLAPLSPNWPSVDKRLAFLLRAVILLRCKLQFDDYKAVVFVTLCCVCSHTEILRYLSFKISISALPVKSKAKEEPIHFASMQLYELLAGVNILTIILNSLCVSCLGLLP